MNINVTSSEKDIKMKVLDHQEEREHFHQEVQLICVLQGSLDLRYSNRNFKMKKDDIIVINANKKHSFQASEDILFCEITIPYQIISKGLGNAETIFICNSTIDKNESYEKIRDIIKNLLNRYMLRQQNDFNFGQIGLFYYLLDILCMNFTVCLNNKIYQEDKNKYEERIAQINNYVRSNYNQAISLKELSENLYLSNAYLSRFFKKNYGMNFAEYLINIRLFHAVDELIYTDYSIVKIAMDNGFSNIAAFNRIFKKMYHEPPSAFRKKNRFEKNINNHLENMESTKEKLELYLSQGNIPDISEKKGKSLKENICVTNTQEYVNTWSQLINIGSAEDMLHSEIQEHVLLLKNILHFQYVRFWNVFSPNLLIKIDNCLKTFNFSKLDTIIDFLLQYELKPFIEFGQKPKQVQKNINSVLLYNDEPPIFNNIEQWKLVLSEMMKHMIRRYGKEEVSSWKFELWYDERSNRQKKGEEVSYFEIFEAGYEIIKKFVKNAEVGGCGGSNIFYMEKFTWIIQNWRKQKYCPDFLSIINYAYIEGEEMHDSYFKRSTDSNYLANMIDKIHEELNRNSFQINKIYVTEWNQTISDRNYINDTCYKGAYIMKSIIDTIGKVQLLGYFVGSDRISEGYDSRELLYGGTGLLTRDGIVKPSGLAIKFLNSMCNSLITCGNNFMITSDRDHTYAIACHNCKKLNYYYFLTQEEQIDRNKIWQYYEDRESLDIDFELSGIEDGEYQMNIQRVNENNGSILNNWKEINFYIELSKEDVAYLKKISEPKRTIENITIINGATNIHIRLAANEFALIKLSKCI